MFNRLEDFDMRLLHRWTVPLPRQASVTQLVAHGISGVVVRIGIDTPANNSGSVGKKRA